MSRYIKICGLVVLVIFIWSAWLPHDYFTWFLEVAPILLALAFLIPTYRRFPLTTMAYGLIALHAIILMVGAHYTYAEVPLFTWLKETFALSRNHYDRVGHFAQGFFPAIIAREILLRCSPLKRGAWLFFIVVCICLAVSAFYELIEWWTAVATGTRADAFLGTQGDVWDSQWDMCLALIGALTSLLTLSSLHDRALVRLKSGGSKRQRNS